MKNKIAYAMKKLLLFTCLLGSLGSFAQKVNIPDTNFKAALLAHDPVIDTNGDMEIQITEAVAFTGFLNLNSKSIADDTGLEAFINITKLDIERNQSLTTLDVSANTALKSLNARILSITSIDLSQNTLLDTLDISINSLTSINLSNNPALIQANLFANQLTALDVTNNTDLKSLFFGRNEIASFNYPAGLATTLLELDYSDNPIANTFDFTVFPNLELLSCYSSGLTSLDVSMLSNLKNLNCPNNPLISLDLSANTGLTHISVGNTSIVDLDLSNNPNLIQVSFSSIAFFETESKIETINLTNGNNDKITSFFLRGNTHLNCILVDEPINPFPNLEQGLLDGFTNFTNECIDGLIDFADPAFEAALLAHDPVIDLNGDNIITKTEASAFTGNLNLRAKSIKNVREIKYFTNVTGLDLYANEIGNLDLSHNSSLQTIDIGNMPELVVFSLDNGNNEAITSILSVNYIPTCITVDDPAYSAANWTFLPPGVGYSTDCIVEMGTVKSRLITDGYDLNADGEIQVSEAEVIKELRYGSGVGFTILTQALVNLQILQLPLDEVPNLTPASFTQNAELRQLSIYHTSLSSMDFSCNQRLTVLQLGLLPNPVFKNLDLSNNPGLETLQLVESHFEELDISNCTRLTVFSCRDNNISNLDLSKNRLLRFIDASGNNLKSLNIKTGNNEIITNFDIQNNPDLTCITVDDPAYASANFTNIDAGHGFDIDCVNFPIDFQDSNLENALLAYSPAIDLTADGDIRLSEAAAFTGVLNLSGLSIATALELEYFIGATGLDISNNQLTELNIKNGNNENFTVFDATGNAGLTCIKVDNAAYSTANWTNVDNGANFSAYCDGNEIVYIPDTNFKTLLLGNVDGQIIDANDDDEISYSEALTFTGEFSSGNSNIQDLTGIDAFENMTGLDIRSSASLNELDVTALEDLTSLQFFQSPNEGVTEIDLSNNLQLELIDIVRVPMSDLDLALYPNLTSFDCFECELGGVNTTQNLALEYLSVYDDDLGEIDLSNNTMLTDLYLDYTQLNSLDLTGLSNIERMSVSGNNFSTLDVSMLTNLQTIEMEQPSITSLDLSNSPLLELIDIYGGQQDDSDNLIYGELQEIIFPQNPTKLWNVNLEYNKIRDIDISMILLEPDVFGQSDLSFVNLSENDLREINIGKVYELNISDNPNLICAKTTDVAYAEANYSYDDGVSFAADCIVEPIVWDGTSWSNGTGPTATDDALIDGDYSTAVEGDIVANNLTTNSGFSITVGDGTNIEVNGDLTHNGTNLEFVVESGGSLVTQGNVSGNFIFERITTFDENTGRYSMVGSPVPGATFNILGSNNNAIIYGYDETQPYNISGNEGSDRFKTPAELGHGALQTGLGYFSARTGDANGKIVFVGPPHFGAKSVSLSLTDHPAEEDMFEGFNLVANPYPCAIDYTNFISENSNDIEGAIYIWDDFDSETARGTNADYVVINAMGNVDSRKAGLSKWDGHIRSMQGFFVQAKGTGDKELDFTDAMKVTANNDAGGFYRTTNEQTSFKLVLENDIGDYSETLIGIREDASREKDQFDARLFSPVKTKIYSLISGEPYAIQGLPISNDTEIPIGLSTEDGHTGFKVSLDEAINISGVDIILIDHLLNKSVELSAGETYHFSNGSASDDRFSLVINNTITSVASLTASEIVIFQNPAKSVIIRTADREQITNGELITLNGKNICLTLSQLNSNDWIIDRDIKPGFYIMRLSTSQGERVQKIIIQ